MIEIFEVRTRLFLPALMTFLILTGIMGELIIGFGLTTYHDAITATAIALGITPLVTEMFD